MSIIKDQILEIESFGLTGCNLVDALDNFEKLSLVDVVYASAESSLDKKFTNFLKQDKGFIARTIAVIVDESHTIETWTGLR